MEHRQQKEVKRLRKQFVRQNDEADCGPTCLLNIMQYYGAALPLERLREWSGATKHGATLLGICQAARQVGFTADGAEADGIKNLSEVKDPCILHLTIEGRTLHYVVYYPSLSNLNDPNPTYVIGDPARGIITYTEAALEKEWITKTCLLLTPTDLLETHAIKSSNKWKWFKAILQHDVQLLYMAAFVGVAVAALNLATAIFSQQLVDKIIPKQQLSKLYLGAVLLVFLLLVKAGLGYVRQLLLVRQSTQFSTRLANGFYAALLRLPQSFFDNRKTGDLVARLNDTARIQQAATMVFGDVTIQALLLLVSVVYVLVYSLPIGLVCLTLVGIIFLIVNKNRNEILERQRNVLAAYAKNEANYIDTINGIGTIKILNKEPFFTQMALQVFSFFQAGIFKLGKTRGRFNATMEVVMAFFTTGIILCATLLVFKKQMQTGELIAILQMSALMVQAALGIALATIQLQEAKVAFDRMYEFTSLQPEYVALTDTVETTPPVFESLSVNNVSFRFPGRPLLLQQVNFSVKRGQLIAIAGESGNGKSTLFRILQRFYGIETGEVWLNRQRAEGISTPAWRNMIGVVAQEMDIFSGTVADNILLAKEGATAEAMLAFCKEYGFAHFFENLPQSYGTVIGEGGVNLSGGQKQLLCLARCLFGRPQLLLLDEPTAAMDSQTEAFVINLLQTIKKTTGLIVISHKDSLTKIADAVYVLNNGTLCPQKKMETGVTYAYS